MALIVLGVALTIAVFIRKLPRRAARLTAFLGAIVLLYGGWHFTASRTTIESRGFYVESIYGEEDRVGWLQVRDVAPGSGQLVVQMRSGSERSIDLSGLSPEERGRVVSYVRTRLKQLGP